MDRRGSIPGFRMICKRLGRLLRRAYTLQIQNSRAGARMGDGQWVFPGRNSQELAPGSKMGHSLPQLTNGSSILGLIKQRMVCGLDVA